MAAPPPSPTPLSLMTSGTTPTTTSGALKPGVRTVTSTVPPPTERPPPLATMTATVRPVPPRAPNMVARRSIRLPPRTTTVPPPVRSGRVPAKATVPPVVATTTMSGPSKLMALTTTPDGASLMTPLRPSPTTMRTTPDVSAPTTISGLRTTTDTMLVRVTLTAKLPLPLPTARVPATARAESAPLLPSRAARTTGASLAPTGTPGDVIRTTLRTFPTTAPPLRLTPLNPTMSGTTLTMTSGAHKPGARTEMSMALPPTVPSPPPRMPPREDTEPLAPRPPR